MNTMINFIVTYIIWNIPNIKFLNDFENGTLRIFLMFLQIPSVFNSVSISFIYIPKQLVS